MISEAETRRLAPYIDVISFDFVSDDETIREVYGLDYAAEDYTRTYQMLRQRFKVVPHLTLGLRAGRFCGEYRALEVLKGLGADALVLLVLIPTAGTRYAGCQPPPLSDVERFVRTARRELPGTPLYLGCMRPGGRYRRELDCMAVRIGVDKLVNPAPSAIRLAEELRLDVRWENECCVVERP